MTVGGAGPAWPYRPGNAGWLGLALVTALAYLWGLDGQYIPKFGDEMVYAHIARMTAESGHWLPLQSEYGHMRNTKPPFLFWQAMVAGGWGADWRYGALRLPSVFYTWATALMAALLAAKLWPARHVARSRALREAGAAASTLQTPQQRAGQFKAACIAAAAYLLFFSTIRYNRTYLTSGPETFWMFSVMAALAWAPARMLHSSFWFPLGAGLAIGVACLYKSFVLAVPMGFALLLCYWLADEPGARPRLHARSIVLPGVRAAISTLIGLALFSLWFVFDPDPAAVWREFVIGENVGRMNGGPSYLKLAFGATSGVWVILSGCFSNAGLLLPLVLGAAVAAWQAWRRREPTAAAERVLWLWLLALTLFFLVPSQRTTRYLIPAMPAVAILVALYWRRIHRGWFIATLVLCLGTMLVLGVAAWGGTRAVGLAATGPGAGTMLYNPLFWALPALGGAVAVAGLAFRGLTPAASLAAALAAFLTMTGVYAPFNAEAGTFRPETVKALQGQAVGVTYQFTGQSEHYRFLMPGVRVRSLLAPPTRTDADLDKLFATTRYALVTRWGDEPACGSCRIIDSRWEPGTRPGAKVMALLRHPEAHWLSREYLVEQAAP